MTERWIGNDQPATVDALDRDAYAAVLADVATSEGTPLVIGLYGTWGVGKTSLMHLIESKLDADKALFVRFDPWRHQFDEHPVLGLLHTMVDAVGLREQETVKRILGVVATALGSAVLKRLVGLTVTDVADVFKQYESEQLQVRDMQVKLQSQFRKLIEHIREQNGGKRLVFFIDDLDRCLPASTMKILESLKLYLDIEGCVYFIAADRTAIERSIRHQFQGLELSEAQYLDKIVQVPFHIPRISDETMSTFVTERLPPGLRSCAPDLKVGLERNPRAVKRFVNSLVLYHRLAAPRISDYKPRLLALVLLVQLEAPERYREFVTRPTADKDLASLRQIDLSDELSQLLDSVDLEGATDLAPYIFLTDIAKAAVAEPVIGADGFLNADAVAGLVNAQVVGDERIRGVPFMLFNTRRQRTWLVTTNRRLFCLLDDATTRDNDRLIQWREPLDKVRPVTAVVVGRSGQISFGTRRGGWLYSKALHPDPAKLKREVDALLTAASR